MFDQRFHSDWIDLQALLAQDAPFVRKPISCGTTQRLVIPEMAGNH